jgi:hypothetical protein
VNLDSIGNGKPSPPEHHVAVMRDCFVGAGTKSGREGCRESFFQGITRDFLQLRPYRVEALALALTNLDGQQLEQMAVAVSCAGAGAFGPVEQSTRHVEADRARTRSRTC